MATAPDDDAARSTAGELEKRRRQARREQPEMYVRFIRALRATEHLKAEGNAVISPNCHQCGVPLGEIPYVVASVGGVEAAFCGQCGGGSVHYQGPDEKAGRIAELEAEVKRLREENARLLTAIEISPVDVSPCRVCGTPMVAIPDGLGDVCDRCEPEESP